MKVRQILVTRTIDSSFCGECLSSKQLDRSSITMHVLI